MIWLIDIPDFIKKNIKKQLRKPKNLAFLNAAFKALETINISFATIADKLTYELQFNGQKIYLQHYLNDQFDATLRRIYIENTAASNRVTIYFKSEGQAPTYIYFKSEGMPPVYLRWKTEATTSTDFIVWVPVDIVFEEVVMRAKIDKYKYAGKRYTIQTF